MISSEGLTSVSLSMRVAKLPKDTHVVFENIRGENPTTKTDGNQMERVSSRPNSLPAIRQRVQSTVDNGFKTLLQSIWKKLCLTIRDNMVLNKDVRFSNVQTKLTEVATQFGGIHLRDIPPDPRYELRPNTAALNVIPSTAPHNMSAPSARFSYDGLDLTGVIRSRLLNDEPPACRLRRESSSVIAIKRHIRQMAERKSARRLQRSQSAALLSLSSELPMDKRQNWRETRVKPWSEKVPKYVKPSVSLPGGVTKAKAAEMKRDLKLENAWLEERDVEMWAINKISSAFKPITLVLISSELYHNTSADVSWALKDSDDTIPVIYSYTEHSYSNVIELIKKTLKSVGAGIKAERLVILCHGGPGHLFLLRQQMITSAKLHRDSDIKWFWTELGKLMSKRDCSRTCILIGGFDLIGAASTGKEFMFDLMSVMKPNKVLVSALPTSRLLTQQYDRDLVLSIFLSLEAYQRILYLDSSSPNQGDEEE